MHKASHLILMSLLCSSHAIGEDFTMHAFAGGGLPQNIQGTSAVLQDFGGIVSDANGNAYFTLLSQNIVLKLDPHGVLTLVAGNGTPGFSGDGGLATSAQLNAPLGIALDGAGTVYIVDSGNARIRKVQNGVISTVVGGGSQTADNVPAVATLLATPRFVAVDAAGNIYVDDPRPNFVGPTVAACCRIRKVTNGMITTIAGNGTFGYSGDGGPATSAQLAAPGAMAIDAAGTVYFVDATFLPGSSRPQCLCNIRKIQNGIITTVVPNVIPTPFSPAIALDPAGNLIFSDQNNLLYKLSNGIVTTIAGQFGRGPGDIGDNGPATDAYLGTIYALSVDAAANIFLTQSLPSTGLVRKISNGVVTTVAGSAPGNGSIGDYGLPTSAQFYFTHQIGTSLPVVAGNIAMDTAGNVYIAESNRVRKISQGVITTIAGTGVPGFSGDNGPATEAQLSFPGSIGLDAAGNLYIADQNNLRIRKVSNGVISTIAGNGTVGYSGDGGPATSAQLGYGGLTVSPDGDIYLSDTNAQVVREISNGIIVTIAGHGTNFDDGPALGAQLSNPTGLALDKAGDLYISEPFTRRIRKVSNGTITTIAGNAGFPNSSSGDGGLATNAPLSTPTGVAVDALGRIYIAESARVRRISNGVISTVAGTGTPGFSGDDGPAIDAAMTPVSLAIGPDGQVYEADFVTSRIRVLTPVSPAGLSFSATPNPIPLNPGSSVGVTTLSWNAPGYSSLQILANGSLFAIVGTSGSASTGNWVSDGMNFSLVDPTSSAPLSTVTVHTAAASSNQITFTANPSSIPLAAGATVGKTTITWNAPGHNSLQIWVAGVLFAAGLPSSGSAFTGNWVSDGMTFSLVDPTAGAPLSTVTVHTAVSSGSQMSFTANPSSIALAAGATVGTTTLNWNAPGHNSLQIWVAGVLFAAGLPSSGFIGTGNWVSDGLPFSLVDSANGQTISTLTVAAN